MMARVGGLALLIALGGCGQVGPLYLPEDQATTTTEIPATVPEAPVSAPDPNAAPGADTPDRTNEPRRRTN